MSSEKKDSTNINWALRLTKEVVKRGLCTGCGACVLFDPTGRSSMWDTPRGPEPDFPPTTNLPQDAFSHCPGRGINYPALYRKFYGRLPENWLTGPALAVRIGHASNEAIRRNGASGGVLTQTLIYL